MSKRNMLKVFLSLAKAWPVCLANAGIAYFTIAGLLFLLTPDIAGLIVNRVPTARLILTLAIAFVFLNVLLVLTYAASLFIIKRESMTDGLRRNGKRLVKGFLLLTVSSLACLAVIISAGYGAVFSKSLSKDVSTLVAVNYGAGAIASLLFAFPLVWLVTSLAGEGFRVGLSRLLAATALVFLMLTILSTHGFLGLFTDSMLIPTMISLIIRRGGGKDEDNGVKGNRSHRLKHGGVKKKIAAVILTILILSAEAPFNTLLVIGEESRFSEDRLRELVSKAIAEGWGGEELANAIKSNPALSMLSTYDLSGITVERDDKGSVEVTIPLNAAGYAIFRRAGNKTTVYDVYSQTGSSGVRVGDRRYILAGYRSSEETFGPFDTLDDALAGEKEVKSYANATRIAFNTVLKTELREATRRETKYAIVPTVRVVKYEVLKEFENRWDAEAYLYSIPGMLGIAGVKEVEKQVWVHSYRLEFVEETTNRHRALMMSGDGYVTEEVREKIMVYVFEKHLPFYLGPFYLGHYYAGEERIRKDVFQRMLETGEIKTGRDLWGLGNLFYYYASEGDASTRLYKIREEEVEGDVKSWRICRRIETSSYETRRAYQVVIPRGYEDKRISIGELPGYAKGFPSRSEAEASRSIVENMLRRWVEEKGMTYKSCTVESYEETVSRTETVTREAKQYYVIATFLKPVYDVYELQPYYRVWNETHYEERMSWVFKGQVDKPPENYDPAAWVYSPEVLNWTSKVYLGIVTEPEAQLLTSMNPRYVAEKHNTTMVTREVSYYDVYNATWKLLYRYYKYFVQPVYEYIANGNVSSSGGWAFESLGDASGEICSSAYRSNPRSLRIVSMNGRGAWRQTFYFDARGSSPVLDLWYVLRGSGAVTIKKPDGSACVFTLGESSGWSRFLRDSGDVFSQAGYYTISFVASENSELLVDDVSVHVGGYGEWVYQGDVESKPENAPSNEKYEAFYRIENKRLIGTFEENVANQYPTPPFIKEFKKKEKVSYVVDLYKLYYLEGGFVRYRVFHWEKIRVPITVRKEESGAKWYLVESGVEMNPGQLILVESNVPESVVRAKYNEPVKYYLVPKIIDSGETLELICETLDENLARRYGDEGYVVKSTRVSLGSPIRFSMRVLQASVERNELSMLGKQNFLNIAIANPTSNTLAYQVFIEVESNEVVEETHSQAFQTPEAVRRITMVPIAEPDNWILAVPPGGASYPLGFTTWVRRTLEGEYGRRVENTAYWPSGQVVCNIMVKVLRNGRLVAKQRVLETFENFDVGRTIARHPFDFAQGFVAAVAIGTLVTIFPQIGLPLLATGIFTSTVVGSVAALKTGDPTSFFTYGPTGIVVLPIRALTDPTLDDETRCRVIGALVGSLGVAVAREISNRLYISYAPEECRPLLRSIEGIYGTATAAKVAKGLIQLDHYCSDPDSMSMLKQALAIGLEKGSVRDMALLLDRVSSLSQGFLSRHADELAVGLALPDPSNKLSILLSLSPKEIDALATEYRDNMDAMVSGALLKKLGVEGSILLHRLEANRLEIMVEKSAGEKLFKDIREGEYAWFRLVGEKGEVSIGLPFKEIVLNTRDWRNYLLFSIADDHVDEATGILLGEVKVALDLSPSLGDVGFTYYGSSGWGYGTIGPGGMRTSGGTYFTQGLSQELVWRSDVGYSGVELNRLALSVDIEGQRVLFIEGMAPLAAYGGSYLPAVIIEDKTGLRVGEPATPSGGSLVLSESSIAKTGIQTGLVNIIYPNKETYTTIYTGGSLQIPVFTYPAGAFVGIQTVETKVTWSGAIGRGEFYAQILSTSELLGSILGRIFVEELVKTLLLRDLTDAQALDVANGLVRNVEWLKGFSEEKRIELVKSITDYVKKGDTAEEAIERVRRESEEYVKKVENEIIGFCNSITDAMLANQVEDLLRHILNTLGPDDAKWLLSILRNVYYEALTQSQGNRKFANDKLRTVVEKVFKYPESKLYGCRLASVKVLQLITLEEVILKETLKEALNSESEEIVVAKFEKTIPESGHIRHACTLEKGLYLVRVAKKEDGEVFEWSTEKEETSDGLNIYVPKEFSEELAGKEVGITIVKYDYSLHFKSEGPNFHFSPRDGLTVEGKEIEIEKVEPQSWSERHRASMVVKLRERSIEQAAEICIAFFEDGEFGILFRESMDKGARKATLSVTGNLLVIEYGGHRATVPIVVKEWKEWEEYYLNIPLEGRGRIKLVEELREIFGYYNTEALRKKIEEGELMLVAYFDNEKYSSCRTRELEVNVPGSTESKVAEELLYVVIQPRTKTFESTWELSDEEVGRIREAFDDNIKLGEIGRDKVVAVIWGGEAPEIGSVKTVYTEVPIMGEGGVRPKNPKRVDLVVETMDGRFIVVEVETTRDLGSLWERFWQGVDQLRDDYIEPIKKYGLELGGGRLVKDIDAYWAFSLCFDNQNKVAKVMYGRLPEG